MNKYLDLKLSRDIINIIGKYNLPKNVKNKIEIHNEITMRTLSIYFSLNKNIIYTDYFKDKFYKCLDFNKCKYIKTIFYWHIK
jgi:hypothetical protein